MAAIVRTQLQQKAINKVTGVMQDYPLGIEFGELMQKTGYKKSALYNVLSMVGASKSDEGLWHLPHSNTSDAPVNEATEDDLEDIATDIDQPVTQDDGGNIQVDGGNIQDTPVNMQDGGGNTQAPHVSYPDSDDNLVDNDDNLVDIDTDADQSNNGQVIETAPVAEFSENERQNAEGSQANHGFKVGDPVYCPSMLNGYVYSIKANKREGLPLFVIGDHEDCYDFYADGRNQFNNPIVYHATEKNRQALQVLHPDIEFERPPLTGNELCRKLLDKGEKYIMAKDEHDTWRIICDYCDDWFTDVVTGKCLKHVTPVNSKGEPLTESDVFGAA